MVDGGRAVLALRLPTLGIGDFGTTGLVLGAGVTGAVAAVAYRGLGTHVITPHVGLLRQAE